MVDENTRFILRRLDVVESRLLKKIEELQAFKNKVIGVSMLISGAVSLVVEFIFNKRG